MIDTVHCYLPVHEALQPFNLNEVAYCLQDMGKLEWVTKEYVKGSLNNIQINCRPSNLSLKGSLPKFFLGNNVEALTRSTTEHAIEKLSTMLNLPLKKARITRLDVGHTLITKFQPITYFTILQTCPRYFRSTDGTTLYYSQKSSTLSFYDKLIETKYPSLIPQGFKECNLLRYEFRMDKNSHLLKGKITLSSLAKSSTCIKAVDLWAEKYFKINKGKGIITLNNMNISKPSDFKEYLAAMAAQNIGAEKLLIYLESLKQRKIFKYSKEYSRVQKDIDSLLCKSISNEEPEHKEELDRQVKQIQHSIR